MSSNPTIETSTVVERKQSDLPRYAVVSASLVADWQLAGTTTVETSINRVAVGRRSLHRWDAERWFISITQNDCRRAGIDTGSRIDLRLQIASTKLPPELEVLLREEAARKVWDSLTPSQQRMLREAIGAAKQPPTRARRARKALLGT